MVFLAKGIVKILEQMTNSCRDRVACSNEPKKNGPPKEPAFRSLEESEWRYRAIISMCTLCITQTVPTIRISDMRMV
jgi:hypothetical protein